MQIFHESFLKFSKTFSKFSRNILYIRMYSLNIIWNKVSYKFSKIFSKLLRSSFATMKFLRTVSKFFVKFAAKYFQTVCKIGTKFLRNFPIIFSKWFFQNLSDICIPSKSLKLFQNDSNIFFKLCTIFRQRSLKSLSTFPNFVKLSLKFSRNCSYFP